MISTLTPNAVNEFRFQLPQRHQLQASQTGVSAPQPEISISGVANFGGSEQIGSEFIETTPEWSDNFSLNRSTHTYRFGGDFRYIRDTMTSATFAQYNFASVSDYLAALSGANPKIYTSFNQTLGNPTLKYASLFTGLYVQDSWKVRPNLTLNYGVRYDVYKVPDANASSIFPASQKFNVDKNNFAPRVGVAYAINPKTVVRVNGGMFYDAPPTNMYQRALLNNGQPQFFSFSAKPTDALAPAFPAIFSSIPSGFTLPIQAITTVAPDFRSLYSTNANVQVSREITPNLGVTVSYLFTKGTHIPVYRNINLVPTGATLADRRPIFGSSRVYSGLANILMAESSGDSNYNGMNITVNRRFSHGVQFFASYTWSHAIDDAPEQNVIDAQQNLSATTAIPEDPTNRRRDRGNSLSDRRHALSANGVFTPNADLSNKGLNYLVNHNQLAVMLVASSGDVFNLNSNRNLNGDTSVPNGAQRPLFVGRNTVRGQNIYQLDLRYSRIFPVKERWKPEFFAEFNNIFNHTNVTGLNSTASVDAQGNILTPPTYLTTVALDPRLVQLGFRLTF